LKKLFGVLAIAAVLSCTTGSLAFGEGSYLADEPGTTGDGFETEYALPDDIVFSQDPGEWTAVIVRQDYASRVFVRLYGKAREGASPSDVFVGVSGIDSPRAWIGDANGGTADGAGYVIIEGTAPSEEAVQDARVDWIGYNDQGSTLIQVFQPDPIKVREMSSGIGTVDPSRGAGCDSGLGLTASVALAALAVVRLAGKRHARDIRTQASRNTDKYTDGSVYAPREAPLTPEI
jgi:hypothetical protein